MVKKLGLNYNPNHTCENGYCLFKNELKNTKKWPKCKESQYVLTSNIVKLKCCDIFFLFFVSSYCTYASGWPRL